MEVKTSAGKFELSSFTDGYPHWVSVKIDGKEVACIHHSELSDLEYAIHRQRNLLKAHAVTTNGFEI